ncbi:MAG: CAAX prenyl protease-related protein [Phycisphaerae bacterium]|nr:CAAX prenyl protease-related protein [Phycisphaerae bacterium]
MTYLLLMVLNDVFPDGLKPVSIVIHVGLAGWVTWLFRHHYPLWGRPHLALAIAAGALAAGLWVGGQHLLDDVQVWGRSLGGSLSLTWQPPFLLLEHAKPYNPHEHFGDGALLWTHLVLKICRAVTIVPIVEELFWRGFILRAFVSWDRFDQVPWGKFSWVAFFGSSLLSVLQHPGNWGVSIACWMLYNALFYWKKSLLCLVVTHGITNLVLYVYVIQSGDWGFW